MKTARRFALALMLLAAWKVSPEIVQASDPCMDNCSVSYSQCGAQANDERTQCLTQAQWGLNSCYFGALSTAYQCAQNAYVICFSGMPPCTPEQLQQEFDICANDLQNNQQQCVQDYNSETASCNVALDRAVEGCSNAYNACVHNCENQPTPTPTP